MYIYVEDLEGDKRGEALIALGETDNINAGYEPLIYVRHRLSELQRDD
jgi:hypothetical protein